MSTPNAFDPDSIEALAAYLAAVLNHPKCPTRLYNAIGDEVAEMVGSIRTDTPGYILRALEADAEAQKEKA